MSLCGARGGMLWSNEMCLGVELTKGEFMMVTLGFQPDWIDNGLGD